MKWTASVLAFILCALVAGIPTSVHATPGHASFANPAVLALPDSAWPTATVMEDSRVIDATAADSGFLLLAAIVARSQTYASAGMVSGYFQRYAHRDRSLGDVIAYWMPTLYASSSQAESMVELGKQAIGRHATPATSSACPSDAPADCSIFVTTSITNTVRVGYAVWSVDNILAEAAVVAYAGTTDFPLDVLGRDLTTLVLAGTAVTNAALHPAPTATDSPIPTRTPMPARPTSLPTSTRTSIPTATAVIPTSTPTATPVPLFVSVRVAHHSVSAGMQQTIRVTTLPSAGLTIVITFPDGATKRHQGVAGLTGTSDWMFRQPAMHPTASRHTARVVVTARQLGSPTSVVTSTRYAIR